MTEEQQFRRWEWIDYDWIPPKNDQRPESQTVQVDTIRSSGTIPAKERAGFLNPLVQPSMKEAAAKGMTLALIRPINPKFSWKKKNLSELERERQGYSEAAAQGSFLDKTLNTLDPCPYRFAYDFETEDGVQHAFTCGDWETEATIHNWSRNYGEKEALDMMETTFGTVYPDKGMVFALGTHSRRPQQWLLVGVIRLDEPKQTAFNV